MSERNYYQPQGPRYPPINGNGPPTYPPQNMNYGPPPPRGSQHHTTRRRSRSRSGRYNRPRSRSRSHSRRRRFSRSRSADWDRRRGTRRSFSFDRPRRHSRSRSRSFRDSRDGPRDRFEKGQLQRDRMRSRERFDNNHGRRPRSTSMDYRRPSRSRTGTRSRSRGRSLSRDDRRHSRHSPNRRRGKGRSKSHASSRSFSRSRSSSFSDRRGNRGDRRQHRNEHRNREDSCERSHHGDRQNDEALGVVSDDEYTQKKNSHKSNGGDNRDDDRDERKRKRKKKAKRKRSRDRDHDREKDRQKNEGRRKKDEGRYGRKRKGRGSSGGSASSHDRDDSFGHFKGGPGAVINGRYKLVKDVGLGTFGRVVQAIDLNLARDVTRDERQNHRDRKDRKAKIKMEDSVAIKIVRNVKRYHESALIEADILKDVNSRGGRGQSLCGVLLRQFDFNGHCCLVFECLGRSLYDFMKVHGFKAFPLFCVHDFAKQLLDALDFIHSFGLIHTDLKPENILLTSNKERPYRLPDGVSDQQVPASTSIKLVDFGGATYDREKKSTIINTRQYRAPEVILGLGWSMPSDLWSAGCIINELYKGELLFGTHDNSEHLALIERIIGRIPLNMVSRSKEFSTRLFDPDGWHKMEDLSSGSKAHVRRAAVLEMNVKEKDTDTNLASLLRSLLTIDPDCRSSAADAMKNPFFSDYGNVKNI